MADKTPKTPDYNKEIKPLQEAADKICDADKKTEVQAKLKQLRENIAAGKKEVDIRPTIDSLKNELAPDSQKPKIPENLLKIKNKIEEQAKIPFTALTLSNLLKEIPKEDPVGRAYIVQYVLGKLRSDGYNVITTSDGISITTKNESQFKNSVALEETLSNHIDRNIICRSDFEQALIISSGSLSEYRDTFGGNIPENVDNKDYVKYLMRKNCISQDATIPEIEQNQKLTQNEKSLLISYLSCGISGDSINPTVRKYDSMQKQAKEIFDMPLFQNMNSSLNHANGTHIPPESSTILAKRVTEDPSILSGKPLTMLAAGMAIIFGLGYKKGSGFDLWTGLKRGFIGLIALMIGNGVAKEWGMDPKKLLKEGMDAMKQGAEKAKDAAVGAAGEVKEGVGTVGQKIEKKVEGENKNELTSGQAKGVDKVNNDIDLKDKIEKHIKTPENEQGKTEDYLNFIHSPDFQNQKLSNIIYTKNPDANIFTNVGINELGIKIPPNLNPTLLKKVLRSYILGTSKFEGGGLKGDKEKGILLNKYPQKRYENKTFKEFIEELN